MVRRNWAKGVTISSSATALNAIVSPSGKAITPIYAANILFGRRTSSGWSFIIAKSKMINNDFSLSDGIIAKVDGISVLKADKPPVEYIFDGMVCILSGTPKLNAAKNGLILTEEVNDFTVWVEQDNDMKVLRVLG